VALLHRDIHILVHLLRACRPAWRLCNARHETGPTSKRRTPKARALGKLRVKAAHVGNLRLQLIDTLDCKLASLASATRDVRPCNLSSMKRSKARRGPSAKIPTAQTLARGIGLVARKDDLVHSVCAARSSQANTSRSHCKVHNPPCSSRMLLKSVVVKCASVGRKTPWIWGTSFFGALQHPEMLKTVGFDNPNPILYPYLRHAGGGNQSSTGEPSVLLA
jgi:hypothetical protein